MSLFLLLFVIYVIHIQFLIQILVSGETSFSFFGWETEFLYSQDIAVKALIFVLLSSLFLIGGYFLKRKFVKIKDRKNIENVSNRKRLTRILNYLLIFQIIITSLIIIRGGGVYQYMAEVRESLNFFFELRIVPLLLFTYLLQYIQVDGWQKYKSPLLLFAIMVLLFFFIQARSLFIEIGCIIGYYFLKKNNNKLKLRYLFYLYLISILPNFIILGRLSADQVDLYSWSTWKNIFTYEYSLIFNNILSETIYSTKDFLYGNSIISSLGLLVPSFLRDFLGVNLDKAILTDIAQNAGVYGGAFSLFAEMYVNFGWLSVVIFGGIGYFLGYLDNLFFNYKNVSLKTAAVPLAYSYIILAMRNDFAVCIKQLIQLIIIVFIMDIILRLRIKYHEYTTR